MPSELSDSDRRDLDETRRLLYMVLAVSRTEKYELVGTIVNALLHHAAADLEARSAVVYDPGLLIDQVAAAVGDREDAGWVFGLIGQITAELDK